jgi:hypothetical protein
MKYLEEPFWSQGVIERTKVIPDNFAWPIGSTLESYSVSEVVAMSHHYKKQLSSLNKNEDCMPAAYGKLYEF